VLQKHFGMRFTKNLIIPQLAAQANALQILQATANIQLLRH
jgi:hypothetical protein